METKEKDNYKRYDRAHVKTADVSKSTRDILVLKAELRDVIDNFYEYVNHYWSDPAKEQEEEISNAYTAIDKVMDYYLISSIDNNLGEEKQI